jgi:hypothetical protein
VRSEDAERMRSWDDERYRTRLMVSECALCKVKTDYCSKILNNLMPVSLEPTTKSFMFERKSKEFI